MELDAWLGVRGASVYGSVIVLLVFVPVLFLGGVAGEFFRPLALAYGLASTIVALTVTPALALILLPRSSSAHVGTAVLAAAQRSHAAAA